MNREQAIIKAARLRKGRTVAIINEDKHKRRYTDSTKTLPSLNLAKQENGLDAVALRKGEEFPPKLEDLPVIEEAAEAVATV